MFENIFFVSYLKNKGIRRICFLFGLLFGFISFSFWYGDFKNNFYEVVFPNRYEALVVYKNYDMSYVQRKEFKDRYFPSIENNPQLEEIIENYKFVTDECKKTRTYIPKKECDIINEKVVLKRENYEYYYKLFWVLFFFYITFWISCIVKWIYVGFKFNSKKSDLQLEIDALKKELSNISTFPMTYIAPRLIGTRVLDEKNVKVYVRLYSDDNAKNKWLDCIVFDEQNQNGEYLYKFLFDLENREDEDVAESLLASLNIIYDRSEENLNADTGSSESSQKK